MTPATPDIPAVERLVVEMTNALRSERKLGEVHASPALNAAAQAYAQYLANNTEFSHTADGREAGERATASGYKWCSIGENLAAHLDSSGFQSRDLARLAVEGWLNSPGHRDNMLAPYATEIGVGVARAPDKHPKYIAVQLLARPASLTYAFQISNTTTQPVTYSFGGETHELPAHGGVKHQSCQPSALVIEKIGKGSAGKDVKARYEATDGLVYVLKSNKARGVTVEIEPLLKVK